MTGTVVQSGGYAIDTAGTGQDGAPHIVLSNPPTNGNLLVYVYCTFGAQPSTPSGWTLDFWESSGGDSIGVYHRTAGAGETASVAFIPSGNTNNGSICLFEVSDWISIGTCGHVTGLSASTTVNTSACRVTTASANTLMLQAWHDRDTGSQNPAIKATIGNSFTQDFAAPETRFAGGRAIVGGHKFIASSGTVVDGVGTYPTTAYDRGAIANIPIVVNNSTPGNVSWAGKEIDVDKGTWAVTGGANVARSWAGIEVDVSVGTWNAQGTSQPHPAALALAATGHGTPPDKKVRGIRTPITKGQFLGRVAGGSGDVQVLDSGQAGALGLATTQQIAAVQAQIATGGGATPGTYGDASHVPVITVDAAGYVTTVVPTAIAIAYTAVSGLSTVAHSGAYSDLTGAPALAAIATSGSASDLSTGTVPAARLPAFTGGDVTSSSGSVVLTVGVGTITLAKMATMATGSFLGRNTAGTGAPEVLSIATVKTMLAYTAADVSALSSSTTSTQNGSFTNVGLWNATAGQYLALANGDTSQSAVRGLTFNCNNANRTISLAGNLTVSAAATISNTNTGDQTITLTGDVTGSGTGSFAATIANNAVSLAKMATMATGSFLGRSTAGTGNVEVLSASTVRTMLGLATVATSGLASDLTGTLAAAQLPALTGDVTSSAGSAATTFKTNPTFTETITVNATTAGLACFNGNSQSGMFIGTRYSSDSSGCTFRMMKARGTIASPATAVQNDESFRLIGRHFYSSSANVENFHLVCTLKTATPGVGDGESAFALKLCPAASATLTTFLSGDFATGLSLSSNVVIDQNRHFRLRSYTVATVPSASPAGMLIYVSDGTSNKRLAVSDGTNWRWPDGAIVS
jgi:hypothetical protein